jgi:hypothetical protein
MPSYCRIIEHNSYAARAQSEVNKREPWHPVFHTTVVPAAAGGDAALARVAILNAVAPYVPVLSSVSTDTAQRIYAAAKAAAGTVETGSYAELAIAAAASREEAAATETLQQHEQQQPLSLESTNTSSGTAATSIIPESVGGPAAAARRDSLHAVLQVAPPLTTMTKKLARQIESEAMRAAGSIESGSYAALAQSAIAHHHNAAVRATGHVNTTAEPAPASTVGGVTSATTAGTSGTDTTSGATAAGIAPGSKAIDAATSTGGTAASSSIESTATGTEHTSGEAADARSGGELSGTAATAATLGTTAAALSSTSGAVTDTAAVAAADDDESSTEQQQLATSDSGDAAAGGATEGATTAKQKEVEQPEAQLQAPAFTCVNCSGTTHSHHISLALYSSYMYVQRV